MRVFMTGGSGYVGSVVLEKAIQAGHEVHGLARSESSAQKIKKLGGTPVMGTLQDLDVLRQGASKADAVLHLGFVHEFDKPYSQLIAIDIAAVDAMSEALKGTGKPLVTTSGTGVVESDNGKETHEASPVDPANLRVGAEQAALKFATHGVRTIVIRLAPFVYGRGGSYFAPITVEASAKHGLAPYFGDGTHMTTTADVDAAADLYLLAMEHGQAGSIFNCSTQTDLRMKDLAESIGKALEIPVKSVESATIDSMVGPFTGKFLRSENRGSSAKARKELGWNPSPRFSLTEDILLGSYQPLVQKLKKEAALKR